MWGIHYFFNHLIPAIGQTSPEFQRCCDFDQMSYSFHLSHCCHLQLLSLHCICGTIALLASFSKGILYSVSFLFLKIYSSMTSRELNLNSWICVFVTVIASVTAAMRKWKLLFTTVFVLFYCRMFQLLWKAIIRHVKHS